MNFDPTTKQRLIDHLVRLAFRTSKERLNRATIEAEIDEFLPKKQRDRKAMGIDPEHWPMARKLFASGVHHYSEEGHLAQHVVRRIVGPSDVLTHQVFLAGVLAALIDASPSDAVKHFNEFKEKMPEPWRSSPSFSDEQRELISRCRGALIGKSELDPTVAEWLREHFEVSFEEVELLPWAYELLFRGRSDWSVIFSAAVPDADIGAWKIVRLDDQRLVEAGYTDVSLNTDFGQEPAYGLWRAYEGLLLDDADSESMVDELRSFVGLLIAFGLLEADESAREYLDWTPFHSEKDADLVVILVDERTLNWNLPRDESIAIRALRAVKVEDDSGKAYVRRSLHSISAAFRNRDEKLLTASAWFFRSFCGGNELMKFVMATTCLEILLGGTKEENNAAGLRQLLASRCAYLVGRSRAEREQIHREVQAIYDTRSNIVHQGLSRLSAEARDEFDTLRSICKRALAREASVFDVGG